MYDTQTNSSKIVLLKCISVSSIQNGRPRYLHCGAKVTHDKQTITPTNKQTHISNCAVVLVPLSDDGRPKDLHCKAKVTNDARQVRPHQDIPAVDVTVYNGGPMGVYSEDIWK